MEQTEWLPVVEFEGVEYVVDVAAREFRPCDDAGSEIGFHSEKGRRIVQAMVGTEWRVWMPREIFEMAPEQVV
jgi:hypothetical protein